MKKALKVILILMGSIVLALAVFVAVVYTVNIVSSKSEKEKIVTYGQLVPVDGKNMNVLITGNGDETVVLLPGFMTAAPGIDFKPLIDELSPFYKVVVVEPFGYGLSDTTENERTTENIVNEVHEALQQLKIDRYYLMGHSISGIYALDYVNKYENEVRAFVGIDTSVPTQDGTDDPFPSEMYKLLRDSGFYRLITKLGSDEPMMPNIDEATNEQIRMLTLKNFMNASVLSEGELTERNFKEAQALSFPKHLPVILFVQANDEEMANWIPLHEEQIKASEHGKLITIEGPHYLHHAHSKEIAENFRSFIQEIK